MERKTIMRYHYIPIKMAKRKRKLALSNTEENEKQLELSYSSSWDEYRMVEPLRKTAWKFLIKLNFSYNAAIPLLGIFTQVKSKLCSHKNLFSDVYRSFICNCQKLDATGSAGEWTNFGMLLNTEII